MGPSLGVHNSDVRNQDITKLAMIVGENQRKLLCNFGVEEHGIGVLRQDELTIWFLNSSRKIHNVNP